MVTEALPHSTHGQLQDGRPETPQVPSPVAPPLFFPAGDWLPLFLVYLGEMLAKSYPLLNLLG